MAKMMGPRFKRCRRLGLNVIGHPKAMDRANNTNARDGKNYQHMVHNYWKNKD